MTLHLSAVAIEVPDPTTAAVFWATLLERPVVRATAGPLVPGDDGHPSLRFVIRPEPGPRTDRMHLHLTSDDADQQAATVARAIDQGARHTDVGQQPDEGHVVLADPVGDPFCVIEPGNGFLAGCGFLGELALDGSRDVGGFWSRALAWPLVWDEHGETAIQSPAGGTKIAWGGLPVAPKTGRSRQTFELSVATAQHDAAVARLLDLGATRLGADARITQLRDPDGNEFSLSSD